MEALVILLFQSAKLMLLLATLLMLWRLALGPTVFERVVAIESLGLAVVGYLLLEPDAQSNRLHTDAALTLTLFSVVGTVFLGYFLGRGEFPDE